MKKKIFITVLVVIIILLGFLRDYIFVSINEKTGQGLSNAGEHSLFYLKWILTFIFAFAYLGITVLFLKLFFASGKYIRLALIAYGLLFVFSFFLACGGYFFFSLEKVYPLIRTVMGIAQSPVILMVLIPSCIWNEYFVHKK